MNTTTAVVATGALTAGGRWAEGKTVDIGLVIGVGAFAIGLSLIGNANELLGSRIATLVLVVALFRYVPPIATKTGLIAKGRG